jgi:MFS transporter, PAT family, beta-lactamase induction signal transducer AmpG
MTSTESSTRSSIADSLAVYLQRRVLIVFLLGFSSGLPYVLTGATLQAWLKVSGIDVKTIGLVTGVAVPYNFKFLWAPLVDALDVPVLGKLLGRRRSWLLLTQVWLMGAILFLGSCDPTVSVLTVVVGAVIVAAASATQDIVVDAFRIESLPENEQAAGMASYVAAYRVGTLVSGAGALFLVTAFQSTLGQEAAWTAGYAVMAVLVFVGVTATLLATEPAGSAAAEADHALPAHRNALARAFRSAFESFRDFLSRDLAFVALAFVVLFKLADALAFALSTAFVLDLGFTLTQVAIVRNGIGFAASLVGGFAGGFIARALPLSTSLWIGGVLQTVMILTFSWQAVVGQNLPLLTFTTTIELFTDSLGTVIFVAYLSALCRNPLYTATQFALLTALAALGRVVFSMRAGYVQQAVGWPAYFIICALIGLPALGVLAWLQRRHHFDGLVPGKK